MDVLGEQGDKAGRKTSRAPGFARRLLDWYRGAARDLPWRRTRDPYAVWVSEIMLQQTQVATVVGYFERFTRALPTIRALAAAHEDQVLKLWEGLGYYRRARQLHAAAREVVERFAGEFPRELADVQGLPGIGRYTAGAILSIAFDQRHPILEANTVRLLSRLVAFEGDSQSTAGKRLLWQTAAELLPQRDCGTFNQALMELGSQVCTPREPACHVCPVARFCKSRKLGLQESIPRLRPRRAAVEVLEAAIVVEHRRRILVCRRGAQGRWAGLWDFPRFTLTAENPSQQAAEWIDALAQQTGLRVRPVERVTTLRHSVTHHRITLLCERAARVSGKLKPGLEARWLRPAELVDYPLSTTGRRLAQILVESGVLS